MKSNRRFIIMAALATLLASPAVTRAIEVYNKDNTTVDIGARFQDVGVGEYASNPDYIAAVPVSTTTGNGHRDDTRIYLFQKQDRLTIDANLDGVLFKFENSMGSEAYAGGNNLYDLDEMNAEIPYNENISVIAGLAKMPWNQVSATYDRDALFTGRSELFNLFFNAGSDTTVYLKSHFGRADALLGVEQGAGELPERYIPEDLQLPVPIFVRFGYGNLNEDPARFRQSNFGKIDGTEWDVHANAFWSADSNAGHGTLFSNMATEAEATKGPFENGNYMFDKGFNPFAGYTTGPGGLSQPDNQFWTASLDARFRQPVGDNVLVGGAQWNSATYIAMGMYSNKVAGVQLANQPVITRNGKTQTYTYGQMTANGGEAYLGYEAAKWDAALRVDVLLPDPMMGSATQSFFGTSPLWEITLPALSYNVNKYAKLVGELEWDYNATEAVDTDGVYQLKTVPTEYSATRFDHEWLMGAGRLMLQIAF
jgi:hypothetical protein